MKSLYLQFQHINSRYILLGIKFNLITTIYYILRNNFLKITSDENKYKQGLTVHITQQDEKSRLCKHWGSHAAFCWCYCQLVAMANLSHKWVEVSQSFRTATQTLWAGKHPYVSWDTKPHYWQQCCSLASTVCTELQSTVNHELLMMNKMFVRNM